MVECVVVFGMLGNWLSLLSNGCNNVLMMLILLCGLIVLVLMMCLRVIIVCCRDVRVKVLVSFLNEWIWCFVVLRLLVVIVFFNLLINSWLFLVKCFNVLDRKGICFLKWCSNSVELIFGKVFSVLMKYCFLVLLGIFLIGIDVDVCMVGCR